MKWLAFVSGELLNSAKYFSSYLPMYLQITFRLWVPTCGELGDYFKPWNYDNRVKIAQKVETLKRKLTPKQLSARTKVTEFIASQKSQQEFEPILGNFCSLNYLLLFCIQKLKYQLFCVCFRFNRHHSAHSGNSSYV